MALVVELRAVCPSAGASALTASSAILTGNTILNYKIKVLLCFRFSRNLPSIVYGSKSKFVNMKFISNFKVCNILYT